MSGRFSKQKGYRTEIHVRDLLRSYGYNAERVPLSGASEYIGKGDVIINRGLPNQVVFEVKARRDEFKKIYEIYDQTAKAFLLGMVLGKVLVSVSNDFRRVMSNEAYYFTDNPELERILKLRKYLGKADVLVIKGDRKEALFITYSDLP